jgi:hypothetical protein
MENRNLPNATAVLILGILSIPGCCFYGIGLVFGVIALVLAGKDLNLYNANPSQYDNYSNLKTGRILAIIGIVMSILYILAMIAMISFFGWAALSNPELMQERLQQMQ